MTDFQNGILTAALGYIERGWAVFPIHTLNKGICTCGAMPCKEAGKHPATARGFKDASKDKAQIMAWFGEGGTHTNCNIAIATGKVSGITVIDVDIKEGKNGDETWKKILGENDEPETLTARTGGGGLHYFFQYVPEIKTATDYFGKYVDTRNDDGYVAAAPSQHVSGGAYTWLNDCAIAEMPDFLANFKKIKKEKEKESRKVNRKNQKRFFSYTQIRDMLKHVDFNDRDIWRNVGIILGREYQQSDEAWQIYNEWSDQYQGKRASNHNKVMHEAFYILPKKECENELTIATLIDYATKGGWVDNLEEGELKKEDFLFYAPDNDFIHRLTGLRWKKAAVDAKCGKIIFDGKKIFASDWVVKHQCCTSRTSDPSNKNDYLKNKVCANGEILDAFGNGVYNDYRPPVLQLDLKESYTAEELAQIAADAKPFIEHCHLIFDKPAPKAGQLTDAMQFIKYLAHRVQKPAEKPRFALVVAGEQGIGKDTAIDFVIDAIGSHNMSNIDPATLESSFNEHAAAVLVRISEAANLQDSNKFKFYQIGKTLIAGAPDDVEINPKYGKKYTVKNHCGVIITTNHLDGGLHIEPDDRRYDILECATFQQAFGGNSEFKKRYFDALQKWKNDDRKGREKVALYLATLPLDDFNPSTGQRKTAAHQKLAKVENMSYAQEFEDILFSANYPDDIWENDIINEAHTRNPNETIKDIRRKMRMAMKNCNYRILICPTTRDGRWECTDQNGGRFLQTCYTQKHLPDHTPKPYGSVVYSHFDNQPPAPAYNAQPAQYAQNVQQPAYPAQNSQHFAQGVLSRFHAQPPATLATAPQPAPVKQFWQETRPRNYAAEKQAITEGFDQPF